MADADKGELEGNRGKVMEGVASIALLPSGSISGHFIQLPNSVCYGLYGTGIHDSSFHLLSVFVMSIALLACLLVRERKYYHKIGLSSIPTEFQFLCTSLVKECRIVFCTVTLDHSKPLYALEKQS